MEESRPSSPACGRYVLSRCLYSNGRRFAGIGSVVLVLALTCAVASSDILLDTVGFADRDRQVYGPAVRYLVNDTLRGVHAMWKDGYSDIRYNFRPRNSAWRWQDGIVINPYPRNLGCMDVDLASGQAVVGTDFLFRGEPQTSYFRDTTEAGGLFEERHTGSGFRHNLVSIARYSSPKFLSIRNDTLFYRGGFSQRRLGHIGPFPGYSLASSKKSGRFGCIWAMTDGSHRGTLYLQETPNNGQSWYPIVNLSDSMNSALDRCLLGGWAYYDSIRLHLVAGFHDGDNPNSSQIWHYAKYDSPPWCLVHQASLPETVDIGDKALAAGRPSIGFDLHSGDYYVAWEQFDPQNIEPTTGLARADIWAARSQDSGRTWSPAIRLTEPDETSKRFPFLAESVLDTLHVLYFADRIAGFWEQGQGEQTDNTVVHMRIPTSHFSSGIGSPGTGPAKPAVRVQPSLSNQGFVLTARPGTRIQVRDATGRRVCVITAGSEPTPWGRNLPPGVYYLSVAGQLGTNATKLLKLD